MKINVSNPLTRIPFACHFRHPSAPSLHNCTNKTSTVSFFDAPGFLNHDLFYWPVRFLGDFKVSFSFFFF